MKRRAFWFLLPLWLLVACAAESDNEQTPQTVSMMMGVRSVTLDYLIRSYSDIDACLNIGQVIDETPIFGAARVIRMRIIKEIPTSFRGCQKDYRPRVGQTVFYDEGIRNGFPNNWPAGTQVIFASSAPIECMGQVPRLLGVGENDTCVTRTLMEPVAFVTKPQKIHIGGKNGTQWIVDSVDLPLADFLKAVKNIWYRPGVIRQLNQELACQEPLSPYYGATCAQVTRLEQPDCDLATYEKERAYFNHDALEEETLGRREIAGIIHCFDPVTLQEVSCPE